MATKTTFRRRYSALPIQSSWQPGLWKRLPTTIFACLLGAIASAGAAIAVLAASDGTIVGDFGVENYAVEPGVLLSIFSTISNILLSIAIAEAVTVAWWVKAIEGGTIADLNSIWDHGNHFLPAATTIGKLKPSWIALAAVLATAVAIDGPLFQRATTVVNRTAVTPKNLTLAISPDPFVSRGSGVIMPHRTEVGLYSPIFAKVVRDYTARSNITIPFSGCEGVCSIVVEAARFDVACSQNLLNIALPDTVGDHIQVFEINIGDNSFANEVSGVMEIDIKTLVKSQPGKNAGMRWNNCTLRENVGFYDLTLTNDTITSLGFWNSTSNSPSRQIHRLFDYTQISIGYSTIGGITMALAQAFQGSADFVLLANGYSVVSPDSTAAPSDAPSSDDIQDRSEGQEIGVAAVYLDNANTTYDSQDQTFHDPMPDILSTALELSLRYVLESTAQNYSMSSTSSDIVSPDADGTAPPQALRLEQSVSTIEYRSTTVYETRWGYAAGAMVTVVISCASIVPVLLGWWKLGRSVSQSPIEIAKAFGAPGLANSASNCTIDNIVRVHGANMIHYALVPRQAQAMAHDADVKRKKGLAVATEVESNINEVDGRGGGTDALHSLQEHEVATTALRMEAEADTTSVESEKRFPMLLIVDERLGCPPEKGDLLS